MPRKPYRLKGVNMAPGHCLRCGRPLDPSKIVWLELDQRTDTYHDFGGVPENYSQGGFEFGSDCAEQMRKEARQAAQ